MENDSLTSTNGHDFDGLFLEVKPEPTAIVYSTQLLQTSSVVFADEFIKEPANHFTVNENANCVTELGLLDANIEGFNSNSGDTSRSNEEIGEVKDAHTGEFKAVSANQIRKNDKFHKCEVCTKSFRWRSVLLDHMKRHNDERNNKCHVCAKSFKTRSYLLVHMKWHTDERNHECDVCAKRFKTRGDLLVHMNSHNDDRNYKCDVCDKNLKSKSTLAKHRKSHDDERRYKCDVCGKTFKTYEGVTMHAEHHTRTDKVVKNYECGVCGKSFKTKSNLSNHAKCHIEERNYKCDECGKSYRTRAAVLVHVKHHTGEKNHKCPVCSVGFVSRRTMMRHMKKHRQTFFECHSCRMVFLDENALNEHAERDCKVVFANDCVENSVHANEVKKLCVLYGGDLNVNEENFDDVDSLDDSLPMNGMDSDGLFLEVKPERQEPTEIFSSVQSHYTSSLPTAGDYKNEPSSSSSPNHVTIENETVAGLDFDSQYNSNIDNFNCIAFERKLTQVL